jgi:hypothetical protein
VKLEARWRPRPNLTAFVQAVALHERRTQMALGRQRAQARSTRSAARPGLQFDQLGGTPWSLQVGRIR